jgi:hypothetical protein
MAICRLNTGIKPRSWECNLIIQRQQIELDEKSKNILKLELSSGNPRAKVITQNDRPLIISDSFKPRIELTRLIDTKETKGPSTGKDGHRVEGVRYNEWAIILRNNFSPRIA